MVNSGWYMYVLLALKQIKNNKAFSVFSSLGVFLNDIQEYFL